MRHKKLFIILFFAAIFFINQPNVLACSCSGKGTVLNNFDSSELVILASVVSVQKAEEGNTDYKEGIKSAKMLVEKVYKGAVNVGDELTFAQGSGSDCGWIFDDTSIGRRNLLYLRKPYNSIYRVSACERSNSVKYAFDDLAYLDNIEKVRGKTRISGTFSSWRGGKSVYANIKIKIIGDEKVYEAKTDENGFFEIYDLPEGTYKIEPQTPKGWVVSGFDYPDFPRFESIDKSKNQVTLFLQNERHAAVDLYFVPDTVVQGKITSPDGKPMKKVRVSLVSDEELAQDKYFSLISCYTDENGFYKFDGFLPGNYTIVLNADGKIKSSEPFERLFYPGVSDAKKAKLLSVNTEKPLDNINIQIPKTVELIEISGSFMYSDLQPVIGETITFEPFNTEIYEMFRTETDKQGRFKMKIPKAAMGILTGEFYTYSTSDEVKKCLNLKKVMETAGATTIRAKSNTIEIQENKPMPDIKLMIDLPCGIKTVD